MSTESDYANYDPEEYRGFTETELSKLIKQGDHTAAWALASRGNTTTVCLIANFVGYHSIHGVLQENDLKQDAFQACLEAALTWDPDKETTFSSYVVPIISAKIKESLACYILPVAIKRSTYAKMRWMKKFENENGRLPTAEERAAKTGIKNDSTAESFIRLLEPSVSCEDPAVAEMSTSTPTPLEALAKKEMIGLLHSHLDVLEADEKAAVCMAYGIGRPELPHLAIQKELALTRRKVNNLISSALHKLREALKKTSGTTDLF